ncbi:nmrA-like family protein [Penicillium canescens]|uniref:NmrA-like family protein n=1 Tax=Penicillium canescens TaxID=5083 RepID=A0AAD6I943_PENCN|nr:nmrA-like family protein [Penicillium canescens]KAJ6038262.1 nmrA-like family protein [Penicillium canescens]KAJ6039618.1 nmrA-like family protein [Penicillium canescens]KAJ6068035.1 nmrA-like family protein [Penicillium canescens]KAJ6088021.1 nmrA-like family protein [Penicillium canescens]KAJ6181477.1 nmrA-like family protein [Penicillium canescens]
MCWELEEALNQKIESFDEVKLLKNLAGHPEVLPDYATFVDLAKFMVRSLDTDNWPEYSIVSGSDITFNEVIAIAERVGASKFHVIHDDEEKLQKNEATLLSPDGISS